MDQIKNNEAYRKVLEAFKNQRKGATIADITAKTALPLDSVRELVGVAADEYRARLQVTESGEILYSFPHGFVSKYHGFRRNLSRTMEKIKKGMLIAGTWIFKVWIMGMLVGYFVLFMLIALASLVISVAGSSSNSNNRSSHRGNGLGGMYFTSQIFNLIIRIWFYSELTKSLDGRYYENRRAKPKGRPLYKAIFSFVFGDEDPNGDWASREKRSVIAYIQAHGGVISLPEFMTLTGLPPEKADPAILSCCAEFGGLPEATEEGTVVYRFDPLLLRADSQDRSFTGLSAIIKRLKSFSSNKKNMNVWFGVINGVNLAFGTYFFFNAMNIGGLTSQTPIGAGLYPFAVTHMLFSGLFSDPLPFITIGLGLVPLIFSLLFWLIPGLRYLRLREENEAVKFENMRKIGYGRIWENPREVKAGDLPPDIPECRPRNLAAAADKIIKELGSYAVPDVTLDNRGNPVYTFTELAREKDALKKYRSSLDGSTSSLGKTVFDSEG
ncbi:hypothetical protein LQZ21_02385 [Treponema sp. TIM-1]|uniref:hypothetical protein n=1 Tax=Treponema sp. TIM-1 TaxID=2898417 RepID=UPI0039819417